MASGTLKMQVSEATALTLSNASGTLILQRLGKMRILTGAVQVTSAGVGIQIATLDSSDCPISGVQFACTGYSLTSQGEGTVAASGAVTLNIVDASNYARFAVPYCVS